GRGAAPPPPVPASAPGPAAVPKEAAAQPATATGPALRLPPGMNVVVDEPRGIGTTELVVEVPQFTLPAEKGAGAWVQKAYDDAAAGKRLVFTPLFVGDATASYESVAAYKEGGEKYKDVWLGAFGFPTTKKLADAVTAAAADNEKVRAKLADPAVKEVVTGLGTGLLQAKCDVDHIVEKQLGGTSIPSNLQLLTSSKNQASGRETYQALVDLVRQIRDPAMRGPGVRRLQIRISRATVPTGQPDASFEIENLLRSGAVRGSDAEKAKSDGKPVALSAGGQGETVRVRDTGDTPLDMLARRIVPGMRIQTYRRAKAGAKSPEDTVLGTLDSRAVSATKGDSAITLTAELVPATAPAPTTAGPGGAADPTQGPPGEARRLRLEAEKNKKIAFFYPYLSRGELTRIALDDRGDLSGEGVIHSSVPFLGKLNVVYAKDELALVAPIPAAKLVSPLPAAFRFTGGELALRLSPTLVPSGTLTFSVGPAAKPVLLGTLAVTVQNGALAATGDLTPAGRLPGVDAAAGRVVWNSESGWSGKLTANTASLPRFGADVEIGFTTASGRFAPYATGAITTTIRGSQLRLGARWDGRALSYTGSVTVAKPLPLVDSVRLSGGYGQGGLSLQGDAEVVWKQFKATMNVRYNQAEEEQEGRFSGTATIAVRTAKADGSIGLGFDEEGRYWGKGSVGYQVTKDLRPVLGVEITKDRRVRLSGQVAVGDIVLVRKWPSPQGGTVPLLKGVGVKFSFPTPVPAVTAFIELRGSLQLGYGVGPVVLRGVVFKGELYPFEDDPQVAARLTGAFVVPAYAELVGTFGAYIGAEVALGAVGAKGGIDIVPSLRIEGEGGIAIAADYDKDGFAFDAEAYAKGRLTAGVKVLLAAELYAAWGVFSHRWTYEVASVSAQLGPELKLTLGRVAYAKDGRITWPSLSQIKVEPESIDPVQVIRDMLGRGTATQT
ncbi:HNH endonuclease signature motif containing protein, partial [Streptomyces sp. I05A-00742]|uniref:HNH endonuclease signature motif containing protein n=1 Tax=Streptomyces sp. I05A-00742 TaxID=2732853 RepID=UPI0014898F18